MVSSGVATLMTTFLRQPQARVPGCGLYQGWAFSALFTVCVPGTQNSAWPTVLIITEQTDAWAEAGLGAQPLLAFFLG